MLLCKVGAPIEGNYDCKTQRWEQECCFCKPNGVRSSQVGVWVPQTRNAEGTPLHKRPCTVSHRCVIVRMCMVRTVTGTTDLLVSDVVSRSSQADAVAA